MNPDLSLAEWTVLAVVDERPTHGFAVARLTGPDGELGRVWHVPRPIVYRATGRLESAGLVAPVGDEPGRGPRRHLVHSTDAGRSAVAGWLQEPVRHVRDVRSQLLVKLALLDRRGLDSGVLLSRQREVLLPIADAVVDGDEPSAGFEATLAAWRRANTTAVLTFLDEVTQPESREPSGR